MSETDVYKETIEQERDSHKEKTIINKRAYLEKKNSEVKRAVNHKKTK